MLTLIVMWCRVQLYTKCRLLNKSRIEFQNSTLLSLFTSQRLGGWLASGCSTNSCFATCQNIFEEQIGIFLLGEKSDVP